MVGDHKNNRIRWSTNLINIGPDGITKIMPPLIATVTTNIDSASPPHAHSHLFHTILNLSKVQTLFDTLVTMFITLGFAYKRNLIRWDKSLSTPLPLLQLWFHNITQCSSSIKPFLCTHNIPLIIASYFWVSPSNFRYLLSKMSQYLDLHT